MLEGKLYTDRDVRIEGRLSRVEEALKHVATKTDIVNLKNDLTEKGMSRVELIAIVAVGVMTALVVVASL